MECDVCHAAYYCNEECRLAVFDLHVEYDCTGGSCTATPREAQAKEDGGSTSRGVKATSASVGGATWGSAGTGASGGVNVGEGKDLSGSGPGGVCLCQGRGCPAHSGFCRKPAGPSGRCASCRLLCACKLFGCGVHPNDGGGLPVKCSNYAVGRGMRRCEACIEGAMGAEMQRCVRVAMWGAPPTSGGVGSLRARRGGAFRADCSARVREVGVMHIRRRFGVR